MKTIVSSKYFTSKIQEALINNNDKIEMNMMHQAEYHKIGREKLMRINKFLQQVPDQPINIEITPDGEFNEVKIWNVEMIF